MKKNIFLTFDMDWASDEVLKDFYDLLCELDVCGTLNVTHDTSLLNLFRKDSRLELAIHPNYNVLLDGTWKGSFEDVISNLMKIVPEAVTVRSHSLTESSKISASYAKYGLKYDLNMFYPPSKDDCIKSFKDVWGGVKIPFLFEDDTYMMYSEKKDILYYLGNDFVAPRVFNFHPIHIFLNSDNIDRYEKARAHFQEYEILKQFCNITESGIKDFLVGLVATGKEKGYTFLKIKDGNWEKKICD